MAKWEHASDSGFTKLVRPTGLSHPTRMEENKKIRWHPTKKQTNKTSRLMIRTSPYSRASLSKKGNPSRCSSCICLAFTPWLEIGLYLSLLPSSSHADLFLYSDLVSVPCRLDLMRFVLRALCDTIEFEREGKTEENDDIYCAMYCFPSVCRPTPPETCNGSQNVSM